MSFLQSECLSMLDVLSLFRAVLLTHYSLANCFIRYVAMSVGLLVGLCVGRMVTISRLRAALLYGHVSGLVSVLFRRFLRRYCYPNSWAHFMKVPSNANPHATWVTLQGLVSCHVYFIILGFVLRV